MSRMRASLVKGDTLAEVARELQLGSISCSARASAKRWLPPLVHPGRHPGGPGGRDPAGCGV